MTDAAKLGKEHLSSESHFHYAVDIRAARKIGIRPLSLTDSVDISPTGGDEADKEDLAPSEDLSAPDGIVVPKTTLSGKTQEAESAADRLTRWKHSLLDLSLRNRLLNFRDTKKVIPLLCPDIAGLEDALADNKAFRVRPKPDAWSESDPRNANINREQTGEDTLTSYLHDEMSQKRLHASVAEKDLNARLTQVERAARLGLEEDGANTLFLALGFLVWTEADASEVERRAPILLIPMSITRKSVRDGFRIKRIDEESRINVTLLQKLKSDFGIEIEGLDPLPEDEYGLDVPLILRIIRDAIKRQPGWKVVEDAAISILTFSRFLMWLDLEANADQLKENALVSHLIENPGGQYEPDAEYPDLETLDDNYQPSSVFCPLHADSSQLRAILAASEGRTFVLQGPPGTGKSQTITNLIAHCLTNGKRVLFVAQKRAALDVVHKRLASVGLGPFCLELHSNKTTKESFRRQLREVLSVAGNGSDQNWESETARLAQLRKSLNSYVRDLHKPRAFGKSAYWVISRLIGLADTPEAKLDLGDTQNRTSEEYKQMVLAVRELAEASQVCGSPAGHPLSAVRLAKWSYGIEEEVESVIDALIKALGSHKTSSASTLPDLGINVEEASLSDHKLCAELMGLLEAAPSITEAIISEPDWPTVKAKMLQSLELGKKCFERRSALLETHTDGLLELDHNELLEKLKARREVWFFKKWRMGRFVKKAVKAVRKDGKKPKDLEAVGKELGQAQTVVAETAELEKQAALLSRLLGGAWQGLESDWEQLQVIISWVDLFRAVLDKAPGNGLDEKLKTRGKWIRLATEGRSLFAPSAPANQQTQVFRETLKAFEAEKMRLVNMLQLDVEQTWGADNAEKMFERYEAVNNSYRTNVKTKLREWAHYQAARTSAVNLRLTGLAEALENGEIGSHQLDDVFEKSFAEWWARAVLKSVPSLAEFIGDRHELKITEFREQEEKIADLTKKETFARIASKLPRAAASQSRASSSEAGLLQRFAKGGRKTIRRLFKDCPNALAKYKPCVLMSPLSVAQFIGADFPRFDMVVFDEASQMPTYDAVGTIARGNQLIVVGDSRQLPPTTFFERQKGDDDLNEDDLPEELESILEEAESAGIKPLRLDWHYRSRHESLIAFSNRQYYENRLHTFPAALAEHPRLGVHWIEVPDGVYDHGKSRTNKKEAEAVVAEIVKRLSDPKTQSNSIGVVTFSMSQQKLVEDLLDEARGQHTEIEPYFSSVDEPVFVKNLETVQGDERDVILFSICYGPDAAGVTRMNFGPMNKKGGERRLNVAITRARRQLLVFSTLRPEQIDLSRTNAVGVSHLRTFLDYAKRGQAALIEEISRATGEVESPFEQSVYDNLVKLGYLVDCQVGCSGYRIDLGIRDPEAPGKYLIGVECDGANYHSAKSARDRDRIRQSVLEGLGWQLHRIWSTDWWLQRQKEVAKLEEAIRLAKQKNSGTSSVDLSPPTNIPNSQNSDNDDDESSSANYSRINGKKAKKEEEEWNPEPLPAIKLPGQSTYKYAKAKTKQYTSDLYAPQNKQRVKDFVNLVVETEAPILFDSLCSRLATQWSMGRAGSKVQNLVRGVLKSSSLTISKTGKREFVWTNALLAKPYAGFRVPDEKGSRSRQAQEIHPAEIANAAKEVLTLHISMDAEDLARETAKVFGITRLGTKVREAFGEGISLLKSEGGCKVEGDNIVAN